MSAKWDGFTENDINQLKTHSNIKDDSHVVNDDPSSSLKVIPTTTGTPVRKELIRKVDANKAVCQSPHAEFVESHEYQTDSQQEEIQSIGDVKSGVDHVDCTTSNPFIPPQFCHPISSDNYESSVITPTSGDGFSKDGFSKDCTRSLTTSLLLPILSQPSPSAVNFHNSEAKQKLMEERNRLRIMYVAKALEDRKKQTHDEQRRLNMIQEELQKLDQRLSCDVSIIRNQIETASMEFLEAQKRYDRAEKEFLDAKFSLYTKLERKELLTHHLCAIIEQNEMRKAQKLSELMEKLNLPDTDFASTRRVSCALDPSSAKTTSAEIILTPALVDNTPGRSLPGSVNEETISSTSSETLS